MHIVTKLNPELTECYFLMAVNCGLMEDLPQAKKYLESYLQRTPEGDMAEEARELLAAMEEDEELAEHNSSFTVQDNQMLESFLSALTEESLQSYWEDYSFRHALLRGLHQGSDSLKEKIISVFGKIGTGEAESHLREYVISPWVKERLRQIAIRELKIFSTNRSCRIFDAGRIVDINLDQYSLPFPVWKEEWQKVLDCVLANMTNSPYYGEEFYDDVQAIWLDFINHLYPRIPPMSRAQAWAAGLEYCLARFHFLGLTQKELADKYGISPSSVSQKFRQINEVLHIEQKAYRNMLAFLANQDRGRD